MQTALIFLRVSQFLGHLHFCAFFWPWPGCPVSAGAAPAHLLGSVPAGISCPGFHVDGPKLCFHVHCFSFPRSPRSSRPFRGWDQLKAHEGLSRRGLFPSLAASRCHTRAFSCSDPAAAAPRAGNLSSPPFLCLPQAPSSPPLIPSASSPRALVQLLGFWDSWLGERGSRGEPGGAAWVGGEGFDFVTLLTLLSHTERNLPHLSRKEEICPVFSIFLMLLSFHGRRIRLPDFSTPRTCCCSQVLGLFFF